MGGWVGGWVRGWEVEEEKAVRTRYCRSWVGGWSASFSPFLFLANPTTHPPTHLPHSNGVKLVILDEADHLTNDAQFALRRVIEKYTKNTR